MPKMHSQLILFAKRNEADDKAVVGTLSKDDDDGYENVA